MYDFKDQLKDTRIRQYGVVYLSIFLSITLSFDFFLFLRVTCKYGSHNSPLNYTRSHEIYACSRAPVGLGDVQVCGPWEVRTKSPKCLSHMKQSARVGLGVVRVYGLWEVRTTSPKFLGHMKLPSSPRPPHGSKTREPVGNPMTCCASPQDFSKIFRPIWAP